MSRILTSLLRCGHIQSNLTLDRSSSSSRYLNPKRCLTVSSANCTKDYYAILGVSRKASAKDIKTAYYDKAKTYHPDANSSTETVTRFQEVSEAYEILGDAKKRRIYDTRSHTGPQKDVYGREHPNKRDVPFRPRSTPTEPISMKHLDHVYKALNKKENEEPAPFVPFADHAYPDSSYNRFEYSRFWDGELQRWVYMKKSTAEAYNREMERKAKSAKKFLGYFLLGVLGFTLYNNFYQASSSKIVKERPEKLQHKMIVNALEEERQKVALINKFED